MERLHGFSRVIDMIVFVATTLAIAGVFYEGMTMKWYDFVGVLVVCMDYTFLLATIIHLIADRKEKRVSVHYFSFAILIVAIIMKMAGLEYPATVLVLWYFYIWFLYGIIIIKTNSAVRRMMR